MKNTKKNTVNIETAAARLWGKGFTEGAKDSEKNKIARRIITENMATDGHLIIRTTGEFSAAPLLSWSDFTEGDKINAVIKPMIEENTLLIPSAIYGHMAVNMGDDRDSDFFNIAIGGHWCAFTASGDGKFMDERWSVQDGAEMAGNYRAFSAAFSAIEVKNIFTRFKVSAVRISEESGALGFRCLHFDVAYKGANFEIILINRMAEDSTREALDLVMSWAAEDESSAPAPVEAITKAPAKKIAAMRAPKAEKAPRSIKAKNFSFNGENAVKIGPVELYEKDLEQKVFIEHRPFILVRTCAYFVAGKATQKDENGRTVYYYHKVATKDQRNTLPHRFFIMNEEEVKNYIADTHKAWRVTFEDEEHAAEIEYQVRENTLVNTYLEGRVLWLEAGEKNDTIVWDWFSTAAKLVILDPLNVDRMFHPVW